MICKNYGVQCNVYYDLQQKPCLPITAEVCWRVGRLPGLQAAGGAVLQPGLRRL